MMATSKRDYYEVLGVAREADAEEIKRSYRRMAMQFHPDRNVGDAEAEVRFKEATEAYEILRDPQKRAVYDRHGHAGLSGAGGFPGGEGVDIGDLFGDLIGSFFGGGGGGRRRRGPRPGGDVRAVLDIDLVEAATGVKRAQTITREELCRDCGGNGSKPGTQPHPCRRCGGQGVVALQQGFLSVQQPCRACGGQGAVITDPCGTRRGTGRVEARPTAEVD